ncbi:MFS transporter [Phyllobacterium sp. 628]|uniref:MFS transporter n=1 Tax=Phyllobacterium sp. 628 TaxID=2718938 RepID=UPI0016621E77|nr:MFS transporter [Phyllobacterium sp. 628]QND52955.1 MFS transporter [Phyllobacterium sp. 628]
MLPQNRWLVLAIVSSALLLVVIDMTVLYTALPRLTHDLHASASAKLWIVNAYPLVVAGLLPGAGALGDRIGHKKLFAAGLLVFGIASLAAAFSPTSAILIASRALLAVGAAMMMPATLSIVRQTFANERERAFAIGIWASIASGGAAIGPVLGGVLLEYFWWGSVFLINVPIVIAAFALTLWIIPNRAGDKTRPWDLIGSVLIMIGLVGVTYAIKEFAKQKPLYEAALVAVIVGAVFLTLFVRRQLLAKQPMIDFSLFRNRRFSSGVAAAFIASLTLVGMELVLSQRFQLVMGLSPLEAGLLILPVPLAAFVAGPVAGLALPRLGSERILWISLLVAGLGIASLLYAYEASPIVQISSLVVLGFGFGAAMTAASSAVMLNTPEKSAGTVASIEEVSYELGGAMGVALLGSLMSTIYTISLTVPDSMNVSAMVYDSLDEALILAQNLAPDAAMNLISLAKAAFENAFTVVIIVASALLIVTSGAIKLATRAGRA